MAAWQPWLTLVGAVLGGIALLYLLRPRRRRVEVPFGGLWQRVIAQAEARAMGRRWRRLLSMLLMWTIAALMLAGVGEGILGLRGCSEPRSFAPQHTAIVIDTSASMRTLDGTRPPDDPHGPRITRLAEAIRKARELFDARQPLEKVLVISADSRVRTRGGWTDDPDVFERAIGSIVASDAGFARAKALAVATDGVSGRPGARIVMISDGGPSIDGDASNDGASSNDGDGASVAGSLQQIAVGPRPKPGGDPVTSLDNLAIVQVSVRSLPGDPGRGLLLAQVRNDTAKPVDAVVSVHASSTAHSDRDFRRAGALKAVRTVALAARRTTTVAFDRLPLAAGRFAVRVKPGENTAMTDLAPYDDVGFAVLAARRDLGVLLVSGRDNLFLEAALHADDRAQVKRVTPERYKPEDWTTAARGKHGIDVVVLDGVAAELPPGTPGLRLALVAGNKEQKPRIVEGIDLKIRSAEHPVMAGVVFHDVNIDKARVVTRVSGDRVLAVDGSGAPIFTASDDGVRRLDFGLDVLETDIGGRYALPLLMVNALEWLVGEENPLLTPLEVGLVWGIETPVAGRKWTWYSPSGKPRPARVAGRMITCSSGVSGVHEWRAEEQRIVRPTRLPATERPDQVRPIRTAWAAPPADEQSRNQPPPRQAWIYLLLAAMVLVAGEWWLYVRRRTV